MAQGRSKLTWQSGSLGRAPETVSPGPAELKRKIAERTLAAMQRPDVREKLEQAALRKRDLFRARPPLPKNTNILMLC